jgi:hypothetical protein
MDIEESFQRTTDRFFEFLPNLLGFLIILVVGYIIARLVAAAISKLLEKVGLDRRMHDANAHTYVDRVLPGASASRGIARVTFWLIFAFFLFAAIGVLQIAALTSFMNDVLGYLPNILVAILIFILAALLASAVAAGVGRVMGDTPTGKIAATVVPALVMVIAMFMILEQLQIAPEIVRIAFAAVMFALALGLALAFGLGGRSVAERLLEEGYRKGQEQREQRRRGSRVRTEGYSQDDRTYAEGGASTGSSGSTSTTAPGLGDDGSHGIY